MLRRERRKKKRKKRKEGKGKKKKSWKLIFVASLNPFVKHYDAKLMQKLKTTIHGWLSHRIGLIGG